MLHDIILACLLIFLFSYIKKSKKTYNLPPGPKRYPIIGNTLEIFQFKNDEDVLTKLKKHIMDFGGIYHCKYMYVGHFIGIGRPEYMEMILTSKAAIEKPTIIYSRLKYLRNGSLTLRSGQWRINRKILAPAFKQKTLHGFISRFARRSQALCKKLEPLADGEEFYCESIFALNFLTSIIDTMMGVDSGKISDEDLKEFIEGVESEISSISKGISGFYMYYVKQVFDYEKASEIILKKLEDLVLKQIMPLHEAKRISQHCEEVEKPDVIDTNEYEGSEEQSFIDRAELLDKQYFVGEMLTMINGGYETTTVSISHLSVLLAMHPHIQDLIYEELYTIFGDSDRPAELADLSRMSYLESCIQEGLRLFPAVPAVMRELSQDFTMGDYTLPKGTLVALLFYVLHRQPDIWKYPDEFNPENFSTENSINRHPFSFLPFSAGPRNCIGFRFGMLSMKMTLSTLLRRYKIETDLKMSDLKITRMFTLEANHLRIRLRKREKA